MVAIMPRAKELRSTPFVVAESGAERHFTAKWGPFPWRPRIFSLFNVSTVEGALCVSNSCNQEPIIWTLDLWPRLEALDWRPLNTEGPPTEVRCHSHI